MWNNEAQSNSTRSEIKCVYVNCADKCDGFGDLEEKDEDIPLCNKCCSKQRIECENVNCDDECEAWEEWRKDHDGDDFPWCNKCCAHPGTPDI